MRRLEYLQYFTIRRTHAFANDVGLQAFSEPEDVTGYGNLPITDDLISDIYLNFVEHTREPECSQYMKTRPGM